MSESKQKESKFDDKVKPQKLEEEKEKNLVIKLIEHTFKYLHTEMAPFFEANVELFSDDWQTVVNQGETLEQYSVYKEYETQMTEHLDSFSMKHGFDSFNECFAELEVLIEEDKIKAKEEMEEMMAQFKQREEERMKQLKKKNIESKFESKFEEENDDDTDENYIAPPVFLFQRLTLDDMVKMIINITEYSSFSMMMRAKAAEVRWRKQLEEWSKKQAELLAEQQGNNFHIHEDTEDTESKKSSHK